MSNDKAHFTYAYRKYLWVGKEDDEIKIFKKDDLQDYYRVFN